VLPCVAAKTPSGAGKCWTKSALHVLVFREMILPLDPTLLILGSLLSNMLTSVESFDLETMRA